MDHQARRRLDRRLGAVPAVALLAAEVQSASDVAEDRLSLVVIGLVVLAALIALATVLFWRATRPAAGAENAMAMQWTPAERPAATTPAPAARPSAAATFAPGRRTAEPAEPAR